MEQRLPRRSSILRPTSQFEAEPTDPDGGTLLPGREPTEGSTETHTFTTMTFTRRSMKRVSFANKLQEVRFFEKDVHANPEVPAPTSANRVMPAEGTDAHHSLLHDPVKITSENAYSPNRMELTEVHSVGCDVENSDPHFFSDDAAHEESVFEKSAYMDLGESSSDDAGAGVASGSGQMRGTLVNYADDDDEDSILRMGDTTPPMTLDQMRLEDMEASCLFIRTPTSNKAGKTALVNISGRSSSTSSYEDSLILPDASNIEPPPDLEPPMDMSDLSDFPQVPRAQPVVPRAPLFELTSHMRIEQSVDMKFNGTVSPCQNASPSDMDISVSLPSELSAIETSQWAPIAPSDAKGFLTSTMVWSGQKNKVHRNETVTIRQEESSMTFSLPKKARTEARSRESSIELPVIARPQRRLNVHRFSDAERDARLRLRLDEVTIAFGRIDVNLALPRLRFPEPEECELPKFASFGLKKATENVPNWKRSRVEWVKQGEKELIQQLEGFKKHFRQQEEKVKPVKKGKSRASLGRKIAGGHVARCWWSQKLGLAAEGPHVNWGTRKHRLRLTFESLRLLEDFLAGTVAKVDHVDIALPDQCGVLRVGLDSPRLSGTAKSKERVLHWEIAEFDLIPRKPLPKYSRDVDYCNRWALGEAVLRSLWKYFEPKFEEKFKSTEQWNDLWKRVAVWVGMARQFFSDIDNCFGLLPTARISFPGGNKIRLEIPSTGQGSLSAEIKLQLDEMPYPDCPVVVDNVSCSTMPLQEAVSNRFAGEMTKAFSELKGIYGMGCVLSQQAARIANASWNSPSYVR